MTSRAPEIRPLLTEALPSWEGDNRLSSPLYQDGYFSRSGAVAESRQIFLRQNRLPHRWLENPRFHICETGFGTGLNFLVCTDFWRRFAPADARLHYTAVEKHPIPRLRLAAIHGAWPAFAPLSRSLLEGYPPSIPGGHTLVFPQWRIHLHLIFDDAAKLHDHLTAPVDAWFLDGFSPDVNPDMWSEKLFDTMARRTAAQGTFATFTAAGFVRRALAARGFTVDRVRGFGGKREMLRGRDFIPHS